MKNSEWANGLVKLWNIILYITNLSISNSVDKLVSETLPENKESKS